MHQEALHSFNSPFTRSRQTGQANSVAKAGRDTKLRRRPRNRIHNASIIRLPSVACGDVTGILESAGRERSSFFFVRLSHVELLAMCSASWCDRTKIQDGSRKCRHHIQGNNSLRETDISSRVVVGIRHLQNVAVGAGLSTTNQRSSGELHSSVQRCGTPKRHERAEKSKSLSMK